MAHENHEKAIRQVYVGLGILAVITLIEVGVSLFGKGHIIKGMDENFWVVIIAALLIILLSLYKAKFIIYEFMHMRHEVKGLARSVLLPVLLLVWAIVAFFYEGSTWKERRQDIKERDEMSVTDTKSMGMYHREWTEQDFQ